MIFLYSKESILNHATDIFIVYIFQQLRNTMSDFIITFISLYQSLYIYIFKSRPHNVAFFVAPDTDGSCHLWSHVVT